MTRSPVVSFGLVATSAAMGAKCGRTSLRDRLDLAIAALRLVAGDEAACGAVADFLAQMKYDPYAAGDALQAFVSAWSVSARDTAQDTVQDTAGDVPLYDWQKRADLQ